jgi:hypothetical protein
MTTLSTEILPWWDREVDQHGKPIRADVRSAARQLWKNACRKTRALIGEPCEAAGLMERAVAEVSRYLDQRSAPVCSETAVGLLMCAFNRSLRRHAGQLRRLELADNESHLQVPVWHQQCASKEDCRIDAENTVRRLNQRTQDMYQLRRAGYDWNEIALVFASSPAAMRAEFSREIRRVGTELRKVCQPPDTARCEAK